MEMKFYLSLFLRRLHWFVLVAVVGSAAALWVARTLPTTWRAEATLVVEREQIPDELASSTVQTEAQEQIQLIRQRVLSREVLIEMANRLDIYADRRSAGGPPLDGDAIVRDLRERIVINVNSPTLAQARAGARATIVTVTFTGSGSQIVANVANEVVTLMLQENAAMRTGAARQTLEFFEQEVTRLDQELARRSATILEFKQANINALPDSQEFQRSQLVTLQERLFQIERQEVDLRDRRERIQRLEATGSAVPGLDTTPLSPEAQQLRQISDERARLLAVLSPENPRVKVLDAQIAALEEVVARQISGSLAPDAPVPSPGQMQIEEIDSQLAAIALQKDQVTADIERLSANLEVIPANAIVLESLERDYAAVQAQYNQAVASKARAETGDTIEAMARGQRITVVDPAVPPLRPASPNRPLIAGAGVAGSILLGLALVALLEFTRPGIRRPVDLTRGLGITPFATLPYMRTGGEILRGRVVAWGGLSVALVVIFGGIWAVDTYYMPLDMVLERLRSAL